MLIYPWPTYVPFVGKCFVQTLERLHGLKLLFGRFEEVLSLLQRMLLKDRILVIFYFFELCFWSCMVGLN